MRKLQTAATIRPFEEGDAAGVCELFAAVNRSLSPLDMREIFEDYIARSLTEEMGRIRAYYRERMGGFWVAIRTGELVGMFGLELASTRVLELRRMYVDPSVRRTGIARSMLLFAEDECRARKVLTLQLSTSELQPAAIGLYEQAGYRLVKKIIADQGSNKTIGGGILRYHFEKSL